MSGIPNVLSLAVEQHQAGNVAQAEQLYRQVLADDPNDINALHFWGVLALQSDRADLAVDLIGQALRLVPDFAEAHNNLAIALRAQGKLDEAIASCMAALSLRPDYFEAHDNLANAYWEQGRIELAVESWQRAIAIKPDYAAAHYNLGMAFRELGNDEAAIESFQNSVRFRPEGVAALGALVHSLQHTCRWENLLQLASRVVELQNQPADPAATPLAPFDFLTLPIATTAAQQLQCARNLAARQRQVTLAREANESSGRSSPAKSKIIVGYVSADFWSHPTAFLTAELFERHDREHFTVLGYSHGPDDGSPMRRRLVNAFDGFVDLTGISCLDAARRIAADRVDVLVDLKGHTRGGRPRIFAARPAPIQVNYLAYPGTTGASYMDYILVDDFIVPPDQQPFFSERLVHLPGCYQVNDGRREIAPQAPSRAECGLPEQGFVFCCFNNSYKITPQIFGVWMNLLKAVPGSVLWLLIGNRFAPANLRREAAARGVAQERLVFAPRKPLPEHMARHQVADLFLDCFPVDAHTTASDALWTGLPMVTLAGETFVSRVAGSLLRAVGLPELITTSLEDYEALALRLARDAGMLASLRARLAQARENSGLFDARQFVRNLEAAYARMWEIHASGQPPRAFAVGSTEK